MTFFHGSQRLRQIAAPFLSIQAWRKKAKAALISLISDRSGCAFTTPTQNRTDGLSDGTNLFFPRLTRFPSTNPLGPCTQNFQLHFMGSSSFNKVLAPFRKCIKILLSNFSEARVTICVPIGSKQASTFALHTKQYKSPGLPSITPSAKHARLTELLILD